MSDKIALTIEVSRTNAAFIMMLLSIWDRDENLEDIYAPELRLLPEFIYDLAMELEQAPEMTSRLDEVARSQNWNVRDQKAIQRLMSIIQVDKELESNA